MAAIPITLQGVDQATLQVWLSQAQGALQQLMTGQSVVSVGYAQGDGSRNVTYKAADAVNLRVWIGELQAAAFPGVAAARRSPLRPRF